jgi:hypothetical protein
MWESLTEKRENTREGSLIHIAESVLQKRRINTKAKSRKQKINLQTAKGLAF